MKTRLWLSAGTVLLITLLAFPVASAGEDRGWYVGAGAGSSDDDLLAESDTGLKFFGGYRFNKTVAVEAAYVDLGDFVFGVIEQTGLAVVGEFTWPIADRFGLFVKVGVFSWEVDFAGVGGSDEGEDSTLGFGGKMTLGAHWAFRAEWERFNDISGGDVDLISGSVFYRF